MRSTSLETLNKPYSMLQNSFKQILTKANADRSKDALEVLMPIFKMSDYPTVSNRGIAMDIPEEKALHETLEELSTLKLNCFVDLHTQSRFNDDMNLRIRNALAKSKELGIKYVPVLKGMQSDFSKAELIELGSTN